MIPLLSYSVTNGNSAHHKQLLLDLTTSNPLEATLGVQLSVLVAEGVRTTVFWVGENSDLITRLPNPNTRTVTQHIYAADDVLVAAPAGRLNLTTSV